MLGKNLGESMKKEILLTGFAVAVFSSVLNAQDVPTRRPNILLAISDDQSWPHASAYGCAFVNTPAFDRVAREGVLFNQAFVAAPQCAPNRASILTGRHIGGNREAGTHFSLFPRDLAVYTDLLEAAGYHVGFTEKGWAPGHDKRSGGRGYPAPVPDGWDHNPAGRNYSSIRQSSPPGISNNNYAENFRAFLADREPGQPFCFWYGAAEPHRVYQRGIGVKQGGKDPATVTVPAYLPDTPSVRGDLLDYAFEIEWFDQHLGQMLEILEAAGELDNTLIVVTGDNGMPFPRAKATLYDDGIRVPMAIRWGNAALRGRVSDDLVSHVDLAPTFLEAAGAGVPSAMQGQSLLTLLRSPKTGIIEPERRHVVAGRERHTSARPMNVGYPSRALRTHDYLYIRNFKPDLFPLGDNGDDVDGGPSKDAVMRGRTDEAFRSYYDLSFAKRPAEELYHIIKDQGCIRNLAGKPEYAGIRDALRATLEAELRAIGDPRVLGGGDIFDSYPRFGNIRPIGGPAVPSGKYVESFIQPEQVTEPRFRVSVSADE